MTLMMASGACDACDVCCANEFSRPDADDLTGDWTSTPLWSKIDEATADTSDVISLSRGAFGDGICRFTTTDPVITNFDEHQVIVTVHARAKVTGAPLNPAELRLRIYEGTTQIQEFNVLSTFSNTFTAWADYTGTVVQATMSGKDPANIRIELLGNNTDAGETATYEVAQYFWEADCVP